MADLPPLETLVLRLLIVGGCVAAWFATQRWIGKRRLDDGEIYDRLHQLTAVGNAWLHAHPRVADACLIVSSLGIDALTLFVLGCALVGRSFAPFWGLLTLFVLRQACQATVALPPPPGIIWRHPGFPSLFVTYDVGNDFFFSGHTALAVYGAMQLAAWGVTGWTVLGTLSALLQMLIVIVLRAHWTFDVLAGLFAAVLAGLLFWPA